VIEAGVGWSTPDTRIVVSFRASHEAASYLRCPCTRCGGVVAQPHEAGPTRERRLDLSERSQARCEQLIEEPIESGADKTDQTILEHRSAVQHRGYSLSESTQVGEKGIDLSTLEND
jgi:hypothetical protein